MRTRLIFAAKILVTAVLCVLLVRAADWREVIRQARDVQWPLLAIAVLLFVPQTLTSAWRWKVLIRPATPISYAESLREILAASALNLVVPAKLGDFSKAAMLPDVPSGRGKDAAIRAVVEKMSDVGMLLLAIGLGRLAAVNAYYVFVAAGAIVLISALMHRRIVMRRGSSVTMPVFATTVLLWIFHFAQLHLFLHCCGVEASWPQTLERVPLAIFAGLVPAAFCGIGTRDAALTYLFADIADPSRTAVVGMLTALRYLAPGAVGIPILWTLRRRRLPSPAETPTAPASATLEVASHLPSRRRRDSAAHR